MTISAKRKLIHSLMEATISGKITWSTKEDPEDNWVSYTAEFRDMSFSVSWEDHQAELKISSPKGSIRVDDYEDIMSIIALIDKKRKQDEEELVNSFLSTLEA